ncbi:MAG TPA: hypothetical protein VF857_03175 [Spirochaetota bacterium]
MSDYLCIYATGTMVRDKTKALLENKIILKADILEAFPYYLKNEKAKIGCGSNAVMMILKSSKLESFKDYIGKEIVWYAVPVVASSDIM